MFISIFFVFIVSLHYSLGGKYRTLYSTTVISLLVTGDDRQRQLLNQHILKYSGLISPSISPANNPFIPISQNVEQFF